MTNKYIDDIIIESHEKTCSINHFSNRQMGKTTICNGYILPYKGPINDKTSGGVIDSNGTYIDSSGLHENNGCGYDISKCDINTQHKTAIYLGTWFPIWGHCITDNLKKLWYLQSEECKKLLREGAELVYTIIMDDRFSLPANFYCLLEKLNINVSVIKQITGITQYDKIIIPDNSIYRVNENILYTKEFVSTIQQTRQSTTLPNNYNKVYFSRSRYKNGKFDIGEKRIEDVFKYLGYKIIYPEKLSLDKQLSILNNCSHFAATEGSISHNSIFCKEGTEVCIIRKGTYINNYQMMINQMNNLNVTYIDAHLSIFTDPQKVWDGPFFLYLNNNLLRFAGIPDIFNNFTMKSFKKYVNAAYSKHRDCIHISDYYAKRLMDEQNMAYFSKSCTKRIAHWFFSRCNLCFWVPIVKKLMQK